MPKEGPKSLIEERLERLRRVEESDAAVPFLAKAYAMRKPADHEVKERDYQNVDVTVEQDVYDRGTNTIRTEIETTRTMTDVNAGPFENIVMRGWLTRDGDPEGLAGIRQSAGLHLRSVYEGAQVSALKGQKYEGGGGGGGGGGPPRPVADHTIDCIKHLERIERRIPADVYTSLVDVVCKDVWIWANKKGGAITKDVDRVLQGLDRVAAQMGLISDEEIRRRWQSPRQPRATKAEARP